MAKSKKRSSRRSNKIPILALAGAGIFALKMVEGYQGKAGSAPGYKGLAWTSLGIDNKGKFIPQKFVENMIPPAVGIGASMLAAKAKANRYVSIPFFKF